MDRFWWLSVAMMMGVGCGKSGDSATAVYGDSDAGCGAATDLVEAGVQLPCTVGDCVLEVVATDPAPPDRGDNVWQVRLLDGDGAALPTDALEVAPFMPAHDHGTVPASFAGTVTNDVWSVGPFDLFMPGQWELRTTALLSDGTEVEAVATFCVEG